jgi:hypothetical protein
MIDRAMSEFDVALKMLLDLLKQRKWHLGPLTELIERIKLLVKNLLSNANACDDLREVPNRERIEADA